MQGLDVSGCVQRARDNFSPLMQRNLLFWIPVQFVQFGFVPKDLQIPFLSCAGLAWTFILSIMAGSAKQYSKQAERVEPAVALITTNIDTRTVALTDMPEVSVRTEAVFLEV